METTYASQRSTHTVGAAADRVAGDRVESSNSAVSWAAIIAGAFVAVTTTLILVALGSGLGLASVSPWRNEGASATTFTIATAIWLIFMQWLSAGLGGYLTGRLRTKWAGTHTHEVFFRDTAHGLLTWALATVITVALVASSATALVGGGLRAAGSAVGGAAQAAGNAAGNSAGGDAGGGLSQLRDYGIDKLFRGNQPSANASPADARSEAARILANGLRDGDVPAADRSYLAGLVAARAGISQDEAQKRVDDLINQVKAAETKVRDAADAARKAASTVSIFTALSMIIGAFIACVAAALGGRLRDEHP